MATFTDQCSGTEFVTRNAGGFQYGRNSAGNGVFVGSADGKGYITDEALATIEAAEAAGTSIKDAVCLLAFSVCHTEINGEQVAIPTLHRAPASTLTQGW